jgi:diguanylate cyclase (GGDEF)-like protein
MLVPFLVTLSVQFFPAIKLYYKKIEYISDPFIANCRIYPGPLYYVWIAYGYFLFVLVAKLTLGRIRTGIKRQRRQGLILLIAVSIPVLASLVYLLLYQLVRFDPTPIAVAISLGLMLYAVGYDNLLNVLPLARAQVIEDMQDALIICDSSFGYLDANRAAKTLFPLLQTFTPGTNVSRIPNFQTEGSLWMELEGEQRFFMITHTRILEGTRQSGICIVFHDNTEKEQLFRKHHYQATFDSLLHIYNRAPFFDLAQATLSSGNVYALLMIDIDHFKQVNDVYGHPCGDAVLQTIARIIMDHLHDPIVGRYGGEEFVALMKHLSPEEVLYAADLLREAIAKTTCYYEETTLQVTVSIGIAHSSAQRALTLEQAVAQADAALYLAKHSGRNCVRLHEPTG